MSHGHLPVVCRLYRCRKCLPAPRCICHTGIHHPRGHPFPVRNLPRFRSPLFPRVAYSECCPDCQVCQTNGGLVVLLRSSLRPFLMHCCDLSFYRDIFSFSHGILRVDVFKKIPLGELVLPNSRPPGDNKSRRTIWREGLIFDCVAEFHTCIPQY